MQVWNILAAILFPGLDVLIWSRAGAEEFILS